MRRLTRVLYDTVLRSSYFLFVSYYPCTHNVLEVTVPPLLDMEISRSTLYS